MKVLLSFDQIQGRIVEMGKQGASPTSWAS
jgi:hypothetical protein